MSLRIAAIALGAAFGLVLGWSGFTEYDAIEAMLLLRKPDLFLAMGSAIVTAAVGLRLLRRARALAVIGGDPISWTTALPTRRTVAGSVLFGIGWGIAGTCPGPAAAQLGRGQLVALFTILGILGGAVLQGALTHRPTKTMPRTLRGDAIGM